MASEERSPSSQLSPRLHPRPSGLTVPINAFGSSDIHARKQNVYGERHTMEVGIAVVDFVKPFLIHKLIKIGFRISLVFHSSHGP